MNLGDLTGFQQAWLSVLMILGNVVFVSAAVIVIRRYCFHKRLKDVVQHSLAAREIASDVENRDGHNDAASNQDGVAKRRTNTMRTSNSGRAFSRKSTSKRKGVHQHSALPAHHLRGFGSIPTPWEIRAVRTFVKHPFRRYLSQPLSDYYLPFEPKFDSKGRFKSLNERQREHLGGVEYRALNLILFLIIAYQLIWIALGVVFLVPYAYRQAVVQILHTSQAGNLSPGWWAYFSVITSFANGGLNVLNSNFIPFSGNFYVLIVAATLTIAGNTYFPIFLRLTVWIWAKLTPRNSSIHHTLRFLLDHPRRCFIWLFPAKETWYLLAIQLAIDFAEWILFEVLNLGLPVVKDLPVGTRIFDGLFQSTGLRTSGAYVVMMSSLAPALLVVYIVIMYISSYPIVMTLRQTNAYEERSIGLNKDQTGGGLTMHLRRQLAYDIWFQILAWFLICIIERGKIINGNPGFSEFTILFEVVSAYGTVGLSTGVPYDEYSLSGAFQTGSKLILCVVMLRGRHRGLPLAIDRSILLPGEKLMHEMDEHYNEVAEEDEEWKEKEEEVLQREEEGRVDGNAEDADGSERPFAAKWACMLESLCGSCCCFFLRSKSSPIWTGTHRQCCGRHPELPIHVNGVIERLVPEEIGLRCQCTDESWEACKRSS